MPVPIDRVATLRNAEKLLRQGKLEPAIVEYLRIVEDQPRDLNSTNTLGDLYVRAGQVDKAVEQFLRIAGILNDDGFLPKAGALIKGLYRYYDLHHHWESKSVFGMLCARTRFTFRCERLEFHLAALRSHPDGAAAGDVAF